ncbi:hypothetical protein [Burkholderia sola]|uniref:hypothetical protein n=1 Tax=Burkholderia sola TaxID=2843302 RepID=UPI001C0A9229|nr:hypothetical protein BCCR75389_06906 [Burkholderia cenocepacia]CAG2377866.1 hypothetical protein BCCR12632_06942 [Burkholderia cenocepacia]CAG2377886.1 hypothetical protein BCCR75384_06938 [Burkholderia cenocepacia]CAG2377955.1 hypothetical protein BCCR75387_06934 [Burkholderia cenocepacia]CAG2377978.1 hypothetical protein BCCR75386_06938 [Burkholderia cenocepacia]
MKKLIFAIAASACAMSAHAANPEPIDLKVQIAGEVPTQDVFEVKHRGNWDGANVKLTVPDDWGGKATDTLAEVQWDVKSTYGPVHIKLRSPLQEKTPSTDARGVLLHDNGDDFIEVDANVTKSTGGWSSWDFVNRDKGYLALSAESAARGDWVGVRLRLAAPHGIPPSGTYTGTMTAIFETEVAS